jgi:tetratricopeptide (TPR) repeat protein
VELGYFLIASKQYKEAEAELLKGVPQYGLSAIQPLVTVYLGQGEADNAIAVLQAARQKAPNQTAVELELGAVAVRTAKYELAISQYNSALSSVRDPRLQSQIYALLSKAYQATGNTAQSLAALEKAYRLNPGNTSVMLELRSASIRT